MKDTNLGAFEELVLLTIGVLHEDAYGVAIKEELERRTGRKPSIGALHSALSRLETKGYIDSHEGGATKERGGRRKRFYRITSTGYETVHKAHNLRSEMISVIPKLSLDFLGL